MVKITKRVVEAADAREYDPTLCYRQARRRDDSSQRLARIESYFWVSDLAYSAD